MLILISIGAFISTFLGGILALRIKDRLHLVLGFSAGAVIGVAFFDLLPEALELAGARFDIQAISTMVAAGFIFYLILDRFIIFHSHSEGHEIYNHKRGFLGAGSLSIHSFLDGVAVGLAYQVSAAVAIVVAIAVLTHDFSDGINTVGMILKNGGTKKQALGWLIADSITPILGIISTLFFSLSESALGIILALFCGFFLYIGASDLLPESHHSHPTAWTTAATVLGIAVLFAVIKIAGH